MRKIGLAIGSAVLLCLGTAVTALADSRLPEPSPSPSVSGKVIHASGTAFTGADIVPWALVAAALLVGGLVLLALSRRRGSAKS